jgi:hypothetical protein
MNRLRVWLPFLVSAMVYGILLCFALVRIDAITNGTQIYLLDDTYIHLAIAKNILMHGVYGISATESGMASSSILWPILLVSAGKLFGLKLVLPLVLNVLAGLAMLGMAQHFLRSNGVNSQSGLTVTLLVLVLAFPMVAMTLDGMEHVLFGFAIILFFWIAGLALKERSVLATPQMGVLLFSALLLTSVRYEGSFAIFVFCLMLVWKRRLLAIATAIAGLIPLIAFGIFSRRHGGMWVPNSLVMKTLDGGTLLEKIFRIPLELLTPYFCEVGITGLVLFLIVVAVRSKRLGVDGVLQKLILLWVAVAALHIQFARVQTATPRYESYLIGIGVLLGAICLQRIAEVRRAQEQRYPTWIRAFALLALLPIVLYRGVWWEIASVHGAVSIYRQQFQAARFFAQYYPGQAIVANDVGAVSYFANVRCLDIWGLANNEVAREKSSGTFTTAEIRRMAIERHVDVGFVYASAFFGKQSLPPEWIDVETWTIPTHHGNTTFESTISFYATSEAAAKELLRNLNDFQKDLPTAVTTRTKMIESSSKL